MKERLIRGDVSKALGQARRNQWIGIRLPSRIHHGCLLRGRHGHVKSSDGAVAVCASSDSTIFLLILFRLRVCVCLLLHLGSAAAAVHAGLNARGATAGDCVAGSVVAVDALGLERNGLTKLHGGAVGVLLDGVKRHLKN